MKGPAGSEHAPIAPLPRISLHAFCESAETARIIEAAATDRRMERAHVSVHMGGAVAAVEAYRDAATPNIIVLDTAANRDGLIAHLEALAEFCDTGTKVVVAGRTNDIILYRELMARGISEYLVAPFHVLDFIRAVSHLYTSAGATPVGKIVAITGAKGGTGASSIAHNIAFSIARDLDIQTVIVDMDLGFGTAGLDFNQDPAQGIAEAVFAPDRIDQNLVDRLLSKCGEKLSILAAPATLDRMYDFPETAFDSLIDILRATTPCVILDIPHIWTAWARRALINADEIAIVASPDLANLRNTKNMLDMLRAARAHDGHPKLIMNCTATPKRPEIRITDFAKAVDLEPAGIIPFEPKLFGTAANNGQMIAEIEAGGKIAGTMRELARKITHRNEARKVKRNLLDPLLARFGRKTASRAAPSASR
ncbi:MAG TPA: CtpF protein [Methylocella sp.]|nr:CtpF protein [Methylocella sp.]